MGALGWGLLALVLCLVLAVLVYLRQSTAVGEGQERRRPVEAVARGPQGRRGGGRMRRERVDQDEEEEEDVRRQEELEELEEAGVKVPDGKIGKKKMEKLQAKADKKVQREAEVKEREDNRKRREKLDQKEKDEAEQRVREEKERKEHEEYLKLKEAFSVEDEGMDAGDEDDEENKLQKFINYIKETKVVMLEDLAA